MPLLLMELKQRGQFISRQLSLRGISVELREEKFSEDFESVHKDSVNLVSGKYMRIQKLYKWV